MKWHMFSRSNMNSHFDIYDIEYSNFSFDITDADYESEM